MRLSLMVVLTALIAVLVGCSGGGGTPLMPTIPGGETTEFGEPGHSRMGAMPGNGNLLWGYWQGTIDLATSEIELIPKRQVEFHANLASILQNHPLGLTYKFKGFDMIEKAVDVDVTITHPYPNSDFRGFDTRGIFMGPGSTITSKTDPGVIYPALDGTRVLNADGYTRWWNAIEFTTAGMYGYDDKTVMPDFLIPETTLNPYKYFADCLASQDPVMPNVNSSNRGTFSTEGSPPSVTRRYKIQFSTIGGYMKFVFHYAVDVSWAMPINGHPTPKPIEDFPPEANCLEPFHLEVDTTGSTAFYKDDTERGGDLQLALEIFDWQAGENPLGIDGEIESIWLESETLFDAIYVTDVLPQAGTQANSGIYHISIPNVTPTGLEDQEILITVRSSFPNNTYTPPVSGPVYPEGAVLAAYKLIEVPIKSIEPDALTVISPNGEEIWGISSEQEVKWSSYGEIENVNIDLSLDGGESYTVNLATAIENDGKFTIDSVGNWPTTQARVRISNAINPDVYDSSDADFTIEPFIQVIKPNGHELIPATTSYEIKWVASDSIESVGILLSRNSGENYVIPVAYTAPNNGSFVFDDIPVEYVGDKNRIKIADIVAPSVFDESDTDFTILPEMPDQVILGYPNGGEELIAGTNVTITWWGDDTIDNVAIKLSTDSGATWPEIIIDSTPNAPGEFEWGPIPQALVGEGRLIAVFNAANHNVFDESDEGFTIAEPGIEILTPNGGEVLEVANAYDITWKASDIITNILIEMSSDSGGTYPDVIIGSTPNTGSFTWDPIADWPETTTARIKISDADNPGLYSDESDADFTFLERSVTLDSPDGGQEWRLGFPQTIAWSWTGYIPLVDISMSIDGGPYDLLIADYTNDGALEIASFYPPSLTDDHTIWTGPELGVRFKVEASGDPALNDASASDIIVPITLGILNEKNNFASGDKDGDGVKDEVENMLAMETTDFDTDRDGMYDFNELFYEASYLDNDLIPDWDADGIIAPLDTDDNADGVHDGDLIDSDNDNVANYLEYYGYTYNWLTGEFLKWDDDDVQEDFTVPYYKTDPMQPSTDQDPYNDGMEVSGLMMDQSVVKPGNSPMIPATPNIVIRLVGYRVTLNADIEDTEGHSESKETSWTRETSQETSTTDEYNWEVGTEVGMSCSIENPFGVEAKAHYNYGESHSTTTTVGTSYAESGSETVEMNWSTATTTNTVETAIIKLYLKAYNTGTACASNIVPTITLKVGQHQVATFEPGTQINLLAPNGTYPAGTDDYWIVSSYSDGSPIYLTMDELKAFECGAPVSIVMAQMKADVAAMDEYGHWQYVGDWNEYMARVDAVCTHLYVDPGDGNVLSYMVYADDDPSAPTVTVRDAFLWSGAYETGSDTEQHKIWMPYRLPNGTWSEVDLTGCRFYVDYYTWNSIQEGLADPPPTGFNFMNVRLNPDAYIVGKVPPEPPLDKPIIHWAGYDDVNKIVYASVTDYYKVQDVWLDAWNYGSDFQMTYDAGIGCYKAELPGTFAHQHDGDFVHARNVLGDVGIPETANTIAQLPPAQDPNPYIGSTSVTVGETQNNLTFNAYAYVTSDLYDITGVYLIDGDDTYICQLSGPASGGSFTFSVNPATFLPNGTERILVVNEGGYDAVEPVDNFYTPNPIYRQGYPSYDASVPGWRYWDVETNSSGPAPRDQYDDLLMEVWGTYPNWYLKWHMPSPTLVKWLLIDDFPLPSKEFIESMTLASSPSEIRVSSDSGCWWTNDSIAFKTMEGRYGFVSYYDAGYGWSYFRLYSLYEGLGQ